MGNKQSTSTDPQEEPIPTPQQTIQETDFTDCFDYQNLLTDDESEDGVSTIDFESTAGEREDPCLFETIDEEDINHCQMENNCSEIAMCSDVEEDIDMLFENESEKSFSSLFVEYGLQDALGNLDEENNRPETPPPNSSPLTQSLPEHLPDFLKNLKNEDEEFHNQIEEYVVQEAPGNLGEEKNRPETPRPPCSPPALAQSLPEHLPDLPNNLDNEDEEAFELSPQFDHEEISETDEQRNDVVAVVEHEPERLINLIKRQVSPKEDEDCTKNPMKTLKDAYPGISANVLESLTNMGIPLSILVPPPKKLDLSKLLAPSTFVRASDQERAYGNQEPILIFQGGASISIRRMQSD